MAKIILDDSQPRAVSLSYSWWMIALIGAAMGVLYWALTLLVGHFIVDPLSCNDAVDASTCANSLEISGNVAGILVATIGLGVLVRLRVLRPLIVAIATAVALWGLAGWTDGLGWAEVVAWSVLLYALCYVLFSWISRYARSVPVLVAVAGIVIIARIVLVL